MRIVFCGTPEFALPTLQRLIAEPDFSIETVITQPDRPRGRGHGVSSSPVKDASLDAGIHVFQPEKIKSDSAFEFFKRAAPDAVVIIAYGQIVPARLLDIPRLGWINLHASLLPKYRGAAPINWAIVNGEMRTGLTTMRIDPGMDTGPTLLRWETDIGPGETAPELARRMAAAGPDLMVETLRKFARGEIAPVPQDHSQATPAPMLKKEDGQIDWSQPAPQIYNRIRGLDPWPGAFTTFRRHICHIWGRPETKPDMTQPGTLATASGAIFVACGHGTWLRLDHVQLEGKKRIPVRDWANGARLEPGDSFGR
ncbi:MAG: methionyl-tRNA formyltransferase [Acidobacteria bacterium]|nr:methionyl-tRNA formyltransferase [Acidobacteriota bacterium]MBI3663711.1 methionyl-tRNA formyltransferase [Acidobacteriota bacterium]